MRSTMVFFAMLLLLGGCSGSVASPTTVGGRPAFSPDTTAASPAPTTTSASTIATLDTTTTSVSLPVDDSVEILVTVQGGKLTSERRSAVQLGDKVRLVIQSDTADEVHVHGYDLTTDVVAGEPAEIVFLAEIPGIFEVEFEGLRLQILELVVNQ